jgi:hypothetical protein
MMATRMCSSFCVCVCVCVEKGVVVICRAAALVLYSENVTVNADSDTDHLHSGTTYPRQDSKCHASPLDRHAQSRFQTLTTCDSSSDYLRSERHHSNSVVCGCRWMFEGDYYALKGLKVRATLFQ